MSAGDNQKILVDFSVIMNNVIGIKSEFGFWLVIDTIMRAVVHSSLVSFQEMKQTEKTGSLLLTTITPTKNDVYQRQTKKMTLLTETPYAGVRILRVVNAEQEQSAA